MITPQELNMLRHDLKRASQVLKIILVETDDNKRQTLLSVLADEFDRLSNDVTEMSETR